MICTRPRTGCLHTRTPSRRSSPRVSRAAAPWCCTTCCRATLGALPPARLPSSATVATAAKACCRSTITDAHGCPVAMSVYEGDIGDSVTLTPEIRRLREKFGTEQLVMVGDLGRISQKNIEQMREMEGIGRLSTPKSASVRALVEQGHLRLGLFDERNLLEMSSPEYPGQRLIACRNPELAKLRTHFHLRTQQPRHCPRGGGRRHLDNPHFSERSADGFAQVRASLQGAGRRRAGVSLAQHRRPLGAPDPPSHRRSGTCAHFAVHARLPCRVGHARGLARVDVCRFRSAGQENA
ncbi:exported hypothetical protein [Burkholderiales bacterium]|nr:exported hypothetical protein [Burkholderiales bacterium]